MNKNPYHRHRFPAEIISHCVWLYNCFSLSFRDVEKMMLYRGIEVTYETIRDWNDKFASQTARKIRRHRPKASRKWQPKRHKLPAEIIREIMKQRIEEWKSITGISVPK